jgi:hypothetical protein
MGSVQLKQASINSGNYLTVLCDSIRVSGKKSNIKKPNANLNGSIVEVQTQSIENPSYVVANVNITGGSGTLTYSHILSLYRLAFTGYNPVYLKFVSGSSTGLVGVDGSTTEIPVILESFDIVYNHLSSAEGSIPLVNLTFVETKTS